MDPQRHDEAATPDEPDHIRRAREALLRPQWQFSLRTVFLATVGVALLSLGVRLASGGAVLDFLPLCGALLTVVAALALVHRWLRTEGALIGGLAAVCGVSFLAMIPLWLQEGIDQRLGRGRVDWQRVQPAEIGRPYLTWLMILTVVAAFGMGIGVASVMLHRWQRRRINAMPLPAHASQDERRFLRARQEALLPRWRATTLAGFALMGLTAACALLLIGDYSAAKTSLACWLAAIGTTIFLLIFFGQLARSPGIAVGGAMMVLCFAIMSVLPLWRHGPGPPEAMMSYAMRTRYEEPLPAHIKILVYTFGEWLIHFIGFAAVGAVGGWRFDRRPKRQKPRLQPVPVEFPSDSPAADADQQPDTTGMG